MKRALAVGVAIAAGGAAGVVGGSAVNAATLAAPTSASDLVAQDAVDTAWSTAVSNTDLPLPAGVTYPQIAPEFFHSPDSDVQTSYERSLFDSMVRQYWRCSWLSHDIREQVVQDGNQNAAVPDANYLRVARNAEGQARATRQQKFESELPSITRPEFTGYRQSLVDEAAAESKTADQLEYDNDCGATTGEHY